MTAGERVTIFFTPQGPMRGWDAYGRVVRCEASTFGYRVAVDDLGLAWERQPVLRRRAQAILRGLEATLA